MKDSRETSGSEDGWSQGVSGKLFPRFACRAAIGSFFLLRYGIKLSCQGRNEQALCKRDKGVSKDFAETQFEKSHRGVNGKFVSLWAAESLVGSESNFAEPKSQQTYLKWPLLPKSKDDKEVRGKGKGQ